jgi:membrane-bound metal-dependent hydrolase YbcI (DUF457 family)
MISAQTAQTAGSQHSQSTAGCTTTGAFRIDRKNHILAALIVGGYISYRLNDPLPLFLIFVGSNLPDIDSSGLFSHRRSFHNIFFAAGAALIAYHIDPRFWWIGAGILLHLLLDLFSARKVHLLYPISQKAYGAYGARNDSALATVLTVAIAVGICWGISLL